MKTTSKLAIALGAALLCGATAHAEDAANNWVVKIGAHNVDPQSGNGKLAKGALDVDVGSNAGLTFTAERMMTTNWGIEVLAALPFEHDVKLNGVKAATVKHLPPTFSLQYHFMPENTFSPFVGVGINYTTFFDEKTTGPLTGAKLNLSDTWGPAAHAGVDFRLNDRWLLTVDARWMKIDPDASVNGAKLGTVHIDPLVYGFAVGYRF
jgi:outer membrane protein